MIRYDMYRRYIDPIRDTYRIIYSIQNIAETVIKNNIQTHYICPIHFMQIEAGIEHLFATFATGTFRNSPWDLGQGNSLTTLFSEDNLTCTMSRRGAVTLMIESPKNWYQTRPQAVITVHITMLPEACPTRKWRASVSNIGLTRGLTLEEYPLLNVGTLHSVAQTPQEVELDPGCDRTHAMDDGIQAGLSLYS